MGQTRWPTIFSSLDMIWSHKKQTKLKYFFKLRILVFQCPGRTHVTNFTRMPLETSGILWHLLATFDNFCYLLATFVNFWHVLASFCNILQILGKFWHPLATFESFGLRWPLLADFGNFWYLFAILPNLSIFLPP